MFVPSHTGDQWPSVPPPLLPQCCLNEMSISFLWRVYERDEQAKGLIDAAEALSQVLSTCVREETATKVQGALKGMAAQDGEMGRWNLCVQAREGPWDGALLEEEVWADGLKG